MISERELDRVLASWLADGGDRAPAEAIEAALQQIVVTRQRRRSARQVRLVWVAAAMLLLVAAIAVGLGAGIIKLPEPSTPPEEVQVRSVSLQDWPVTMSIPEAWTEIEGPCCELRRYEGAFPEGSLSYSHDSPFRATLCTPDCQLVELPVAIPYAASEQMEALQAGVGALAGSVAWTTLPRGTVEGLDAGARRLEVVAGDRTNVFVVGVRKRNIVAITWSQPTAAYDSALFERVLAGTEILDGPGYASGELVRTRPGLVDYTMVAPDLWVEDNAPTFNGEAAVGVESRAEGTVIVSVGDQDGDIRLCDPMCREVSDIANLDDLERAVLGSIVPTANVPRSLGGEAGRSLLFDGQGADGTAIRRHVVIAFHDDRPVVLSIELRDEVAASVFESLVDGFAFTGRAQPATQVITSPDGQVEISLPGGWSPVERPDGPFLLAKGRQRMTIRLGDENDRLRTCDEPSGAWEVCHVIQASTLVELAAATKLKPADEHGTGQLITRTDDTLDGEPAIIWELQGYEYPAHGAEWLTYVVAVINERPVLIRIWSPVESGIVDLDAVMKGFHLVD